MADALLAGLPRIIRAADEVRLRGLLALALAFAAAAWWTIQWLLDQPVDPERTWSIALIVAVLGGIIGAFNAPWRLREGLRETRRPNVRVVYETRADGAERRTRLSGAVFLTVIVVVTIDALAGWGGVVAGVVIGATLVAGLCDLWESRRWAAEERERDADLYVAISGNALVAGYGRPVIYEVTTPPPDMRDR